MEVEIQTIVNQTPRFIDALQDTFRNIGRKADIESFRVEFGDTTFYNSPDAEKWNPSVELKQVSWSRKFGIFPVRKTVCLAAAGTKLQRGPSNELILNARIFTLAVQASVEQELKDLAERFEISTIRIIAQYE